MTARLSAFVAKVRSLFTGRRADREFDEELEAHISLLSERFVREGMTPDEARYAALRQFGNVTSLRERCTEMRTFAPLQSARPGPALRRARASAKSRLDQSSPC